MKKMYMVKTTGWAKDVNKVYLNKETAEKVAKEIAYNLYMSGSNDTAYVEEVEVVEE